MKRIVWQVLQAVHFCHQHNVSASCCNVCLLFALKLGCTIVLFLKMVPSNTPCSFHLFLVVYVLVHSS